MKQRAYGSRTYRRSVISKPTRRAKAKALEQTREAIIGYLEAAAQEGIPVPGPENDAEIVELEIATPWADS